MAGIAGGLSFLGAIVFLMLFRVPHEERVLIEQFGDEYRDYMARTRRFLPMSRH